MKKIVYFDLDGTLADFIGHVIKKFPEFEAAPAEKRKELIDIAKKSPDFFRDLDAIEGAEAAFVALAENPNFDCYILSTPSWSAPNAWGDKRLWVDEKFGKLAFKRLILTHHKHLNMGDYLIDDRTANGAGEFNGEHIHYGTEKFPDWKAVVEYLLAEVA